MYEGYFGGFSGRLLQEDRARIEKRSENCFVVFILACSILMHSITLAYLLLHSQATDLLKAYKNKPKH